MLEMQYIKRIKQMQKWKKYLLNVSIDCTLLNNYGEKVQISPLKCGENVQMPPIKCREKIQIIPIKCGEKVQIAF